MVKARIFEYMKTFRSHGPLFLSMLFSTAGAAVSLPPLVDVLLKAFCPGKIECSEVIYLSGLQAVIVGLGATVMAPVLGDFLTIMGVNQFYLLLAYSRDATFVYVWWGLNVVGTVMKDAGVLTIAFAYMADVFADLKIRSTAMGVAMSFVWIGLLAGTLIGRLLSTAQLFQASAVCHLTSTAIVKFFLIESHPKHTAEKLILTHEDEAHRAAPLLPKPDRKSSVRRALGTVGNSGVFRSVAVVAFMVNMAESISSTTILYYLKAVFGFSKDEYAEFLIVMGVALLVVQTLLYPILTQHVDERRVLILGLLGGAICHYLLAFAWDAWVPYFAICFAAFAGFIYPSIGSIVSRGATPDEQGSVQGVIASAKTTGYVLGPLVGTPVAALFLSDNPPFDFPGFPQMICAVSVTLAMCIAFGVPRMSYDDSNVHMITPTPELRKHDNIVEELENGERRTRERDEENV